MEQKETGEWSKKKQKIGAKKQENEAKRIKVKERILKESKQEKRGTEKLRSEKQKLKKRKLKYMWAALALFLVLYIGGTAVSIWSYGKVDEKQRADAAIVLGAAVYGEKVSPVFAERLNHGIWLYENDYVEKLIVTGGMGEGNRYSDAYAGKKYMMEQGVSEEDILIEEESAITQENLENAKELMDKNGYVSAIVVSDPLHMKRAMLMAEDSGIEAYSSPTPTTRYKTWKSKVPFLAREEFFYIGYKLCRLFCGGHGISNQDVKILWIPGGPSYVESVDGRLCDQFAGILGIDASAI